MPRKRFLATGMIVLTAIILGSEVAPALRRALARGQASSEGRLGMAAEAPGAYTDAALPHLPKLRIGADNRHLIEDENGKPFFMAGVCPQSMVHWSMPEQMDAYFADREKRHFNFAWVVVNAFDLAGKTAMTNPTAARGDSMLLHGTSWDPKNLNPAYVAAVDAMVKSAAEHGIYLFLDPFSCGYSPGPDGFDPTKHSPQEMRRWGEFWGERYQDYTNVNFALGNDRLVWPQVDEVVSGFERFLPDRLVTIDWIGGPPNWSSDGKGPHKFYEAGHHWVNFNGWYEYHAPQWATWYHYHMTGPVMPTAIFETMYEHVLAGNPQHILTPPQTIREEVHKR